MSRSHPVSRNVGATWVACLVLVALFMVPGTHAWWWSSAAEAAPSNTSTPSSPMAGSIPAPPYSVPTFSNPIQPSMPAPPWRAPGASTPSPTPWSTPSSSGPAPSNSNSPLPNNPMYPPPPGTSGNGTSNPLASPIRIAVLGCNQVSSYCCGGYCESFSGCPPAPDTCDSDDVVTLTTTNSVEIDRSNRGYITVTFDEKGCPYAGGTALNATNTWVGGYVYSCPSIGDFTCRSYYQCNFRVCAMDIPPQCIDPKIRNGNGPSSDANHLIVPGFGLLALVLMLVAF